MSDAGTATGTNTGASGGNAGTGGGAAGGSPPGGTAPPPPSFIEQIPEAIRSEAYFKDLKDVGALATRAFSQAKMIGVPQDQLLRLAGPDDTAGWDAIYTKLGRPEAPDKYLLADPQGLPEGLVLDPGVKTGLAALAHELGLNQKQAAKLYERTIGGRAEAFKAALASEADGLRQAEATLKSEFGGAYEGKIADINMVVDRLDAELKLGGALEQAIAQMPAGSRVPLAKAFDRIAGLYKEHNITGSGGPGGMGGALTPATAQQQINAMWADPATSRTLRDQHAPGHAEALARMQKYYEDAYPEPNAA